MIYYKEPQSTLFSVKMVNATSGDVDVSSEQFGVSVVYMLISAAGVMSSFMTAQMQENGVLDNMTDYTEDLMSSLSAWNALLWIIVLLSHFLVAALVCSPADIYMLCLTTFGITVTLKQMCGPSRRRSDSFSLIVFMLLAGVVLTEMHSHHGVRLLAWVAILMADVTLVIGHSFEQHVNIETVANCRIFYCSFVLVLLLILYTI